MRRAVLVLALLSLAAAEGPCGGPAPGGSDPCAGRACGEGCTLCPPGATDCVETAVLKACSPFGQCVAASPDLCAPSTAPCVTRRCGDPCVVEPACRSAVPPCLVPSRAGLCDRDGACETRLPVGPGLCTPPIPDWGCRGKACGDACGFCPPDADPATCPVPTFAATACDGLLRCVNAGTFTCGP